MSPKPKSNGVYRFLMESGVLEHGTPENIAQKRREYWNDVKRKSKKEKRARETEFKIYLTDSELQDIAKGAQKYGMSKTRFITYAALSFACNKYLLVDKQAVHTISQLLSLNLSAIDRLVEDGIVSDGIGCSLVNRVAELERMVLGHFTDPTTLEHAVIRAIAEEPSYKTKLIAVIENAQP